MVTRKDIEKLGFYYYGEGYNTRNNQKIKAYSLKLEDDSYCHIHFFDNEDGSIYIYGIETTDIYGGADSPFAGHREGGSGPYAVGGLRITSDNHLEVMLDILGVIIRDD